MEKAKMGSRYVLGLIFFVFGLNGFLGFMPMPPMPEAAQSFMGGLASSGYFFPFLKATEVVCGALLLANVLSPVALIILAPISLNIFLFHFALAPEGMIIGTLVLVLNAFLIYAHLNLYRPTFGKLS